MAGITYRSFQHFLPELPRKARYTVVSIRKMFGPNSEQGLVDRPGAYEACSTLRHSKRAMLDTFQELPELVCI